MSLFIFITCNQGNSGNAVEIIRSAHKHFYQADNSQAQFKDIL